MISYNKQSISKKDITFVSKVLKQDIITRGNTVLNFEKKISKLVKSKYSVSFNSASSGLTAACFALDLKKNDLVWTVPNTFVASASCALHFSAKIDFVDIDKFYKNISIDELEKKLAISKKKNKLPKLLITVHFGGQAPNQNRIFNLSRKYGFKIIEDASHSFGGSRKNEPIGSCKWADMTISSFHPVKIITTGEGGVACTNSKLLFERLKIYRNNGIVRDYKYLKNKSLDKFYYEQQFLGHNFHMSDINAALGISQISKIKIFIKKREQIFKYYNKHLNENNLLLPKIEKENRSTHHLYIVNLKNEINREKIFKHMYKKGINLNVHYIPVHLHPYYFKKGFRMGNFPVSEWHYKTAISLPIYYDLSFKQIDIIIKEINKVSK